MPFASKAHRTKVRELLALGKITRAQYDEIEKDTTGSLPDRAESEESDTAGQAPDKPSKKKVNPFW